MVSMSGRLPTRSHAALTLLLSLGLSAPAVSQDEGVWTAINSDAAWTRRAGLQVVELGGSFYLLGGRTSRPWTFPPIPGDSDIWGDVWRSDDRGLTWERILETDDANHWPARAYFRAVAKDEQIFVLGGQNYLLEPNPDCPPPHFGCTAFVSVSDFFNDVWSSSDGVTWTQRSAEAGWSPRAGLSAAVFKGELYVIGGSFQDDAAIVGGPPMREYFNDVWKSADGATWELCTDDPPFAPRAGAVALAKGDYLYLFGGETGFLCDPLPFCTLPYFNDVWRTRDGIEWELVTPAAEWAPRPGHQVVVVDDRFLLFGGFGLNPFNPFAQANPLDVWVSDDGARWTLASNSPWNAVFPEEIKYDFAVLSTQAVVRGHRVPAVYTFGGDRETFNFFDPVNYLDMDNDVWRFLPPASGCLADLDGDGTVGPFDLIQLLRAWGPCDGCPEDLDQNGHVGWQDLRIVLGQQGACR